MISKECSNFHITLFLVFFQDYSVSVHVSNNPGQKDMSVELYMRSLGSSQKSEAFTDFTGFKNKQWQPYKNASYELPFTFFVPNVYYKVRWFLLAIFHYRFYFISHSSHTFSLLVSVHISLTIIFKTRDK